MKKWKLGLLAGMTAVPGAAAAQYEAPVNRPEPAAHLREMLSIYESVCLNAFPDDAAAERQALAAGGQAMTAERVRALLHDDPGRGWTVDGRTARFELTIEAPPYHSCAVRTITAAGFPDTAPYRTMADRYERRGAFRRVGPIEQTIAGLHVVAAGEQAQIAGGRTDSLMLFLTTPDDAHRARGQTAVEVRFVHQMYDAGRR